MFSDKHDIKILCLMIIKKLTSSNVRVQQLAAEIDLFSVVSSKLGLLINVLQSHRYLETSKKKGAQKVILDPLFTHSPEFN